MIDRELANSITHQYDEISKVFGEFQHKSKLPCPEGCGKCCFKPDISCAPYELLPLALHLLETKRAERFLEKAKEAHPSRCLLLEVTDEEKGMGRCSEYRFRPFICRAFGVSARHGKKGKVDYSICRILKDNDHFSPEFDFTENEIPFIEVWKKRFEALDPHLLEKEIPINEALVYILERALLWDSYREK
ncbi:MAG: YkgJ family cysteine cluster protein [Bacteriovorax sp.]